MLLRTFVTGVLAACLLGSLTLTSPAAAAPAPGDAVLHGPGASKPGGESLRTWSTRNYRWFQEVGGPLDLGTDPDSPANCDARRGAVFFGPVGTGDDCVVPVGAPIVLAYLGWSCSTAEGNGRTFGELRRCSQDAWRTELGDVRIKQVIDGDVVRRPRRWTVTSHDMWVDLPRNNVWGVRPGWTRSVGTGIIQVLRPPSVGEHLIRVRLVEDGKTTRLRYPFTVQ